MKRWPLVVLGLVSATALVTVFVLVRENLALRRDLAAARAVQPDVIASAPAAALDPAGRSAETISPAVEAPPAPTSAGEQPPEDTQRRRGQDRRDRGAETFARALSDPDARAAMLTRMKSEVDRRFGDYFVKLGLDEFQIEALRTVLAERQLARMDAGMLERTAETDEERAEAKAWRDAKLASTEAEINGLLGPDGFKNLQGYLDSAPQRQLVDDIARRASYAGAPLSDEANSRLVAALSQARTDHPVPQLPGPGRGGWNGGGDFGPITPERVEEYLGNLRAQNQQVIEQSRSFLTQPQLEAIVDQQLDQLQQAEAQLNFMLRNPDVRGPGGDGRAGGRAPRG